MAKSNFFIALCMLCGLALAHPSPASAQQAGADSIGQVATLQGSATVTRGGATRALNINDEIFQGDVLATGADGALGVTFEDETSFNLSANARISVDDFLYAEGGASNSALFNVARGTIAFVAEQVAKTGDMKIATPTATLGIRGTTGLIEVPEGAASGSGEAQIKLYPDANGAVGRIEVFDRQGARLGLLSRGASAFAIRPQRAGGALRFAAVAFQIPAQQAARDRGLVQRLFVAHNAGRQLMIERRQFRQQNLQRQPFQKGAPGLQKGAPGLQRGAPGQPGFPKGPGLQKGPGQPGLQRQPGLAPGQPGLQQPTLAQPGAPKQTPPGLRERVKQNLKKLNPFGKKSGEERR